MTKAELKEIEEIFTYLAQGNNRGTSIRLDGTASIKTIAAQKGKELLTEVKRLREPPKIDLRRASNNKIRVLVHIGDDTHVYRENNPQEDKMSLTEQERKEALSELKSPDCPECGDELEAHDDGMGAYIVCDACGYSPDDEKES